MVTSNYEIELVEGHFDANKIYCQVRNNSWNKPPNAAGGAFLLLQADALVRTSWSLAQAKASLGDRGQYITELPDPVIVRNLQGDWQTSGPESGFYKMAIPEKGQSANAQFSINWDNLTGASLPTYSINLSKLGYNASPDLLTEMLLSFPQGILVYMNARFSRFVKARLNSLTIRRM